MCDGCTCLLIHKREIEHVSEREKSAEKHPADYVQSFINAPTRAGKYHYYMRDIALSQASEDWGSCTHEDMLKFNMNVY